MTSEPVSSAPVAGPGCEELAGRVCAGDRTAFALLVQRHLHKVVTIAQRVVLRRAEAEDVAQDVFAKFWAQPQLYRPDRAKFSTWLYRVTLNRALDVARRVKPLPMAADFDMADPAPSAHEQLARQQRSAALAQALADLPERQRAALALSYQADMPDVDAAASLGISVKAYESLLVRARRALRERLMTGGLHDAG